VIDVTECQEAGNWSRQSAREFQTLAENLPDCIVRYDFNCMRTYVNSTYESHSGIPVGQALNQPLEMNWRADIRAEEYKEILKEVMRTGVPRQICVNFSSSKGTQGYYALHIVAEKNAGGEVVGALVIARRIGDLNEAERQLGRSRRCLRYLADRIEMVRDEERKHLARELHDELGQHLLALRTQISALDLEFGKYDRKINQSTARMIAVVDSTLRVVRNLICALRQNELEAGIVAALEWLTAEFASKTGVSCKLKALPLDILPSEKGAVGIFRIVQEALRNVAQHACAREVRVEFRRSDEHYILKVSDDGIGFDLQATKSGAFGLLGIRERVLALDGKLDIRSAPGTGTLISVLIPVK